MVKKRNDNRYAVTMRHNGKKLFFYGSTRREAERQRDLYRQNIETLPYYDENLLVDEWAAEWLNNASQTVSANTLKDYQRIVTNYIVPSIGKCPLNDLQPQHIRNLLKHLLDSGRTRTVTYTYTVLKALLQNAVDDRIILYNPMAKIKRPKVVKKEICALSKEQANKLLACIKNPEHYNLFYIELKTGLRRGELLGLRWQDVNWENETISAGQYTVIRAKNGVQLKRGGKTESSTRTISIDSTTIAILHRQRAIVEEHQRKALYWNDYDLIFPSKNGNPRNPDRITTLTTEYRKKAGLPENFTFHGCRHTHASLLLEANANIKDIQMRLGHSTFQQTMDTYSHLLPHVEKRIKAQLQHIL